MKTLAISPLAQEILVRRLAQYDAPWLPIRQPDLDSYNSPGAIWHAQQPGYRPPPLGANAAREVDRQEFSRAGAELVQAGYAEPTVGRIAPRLTVEGEHVARGLAWACDARDLRIALERVAAAVEARHTFDICGVGGFVPEPLVTGVAWSLADPESRLAIRQIGRTLLPAFKCGLVESRCALGGFNSFRLAKPLPANPLVELLGGDDYGELFVEDLADIYSATLLDSRRRIREHDAGGELGHYPASVRKLDNGRDWNDVAGIEPLFPDAAAVGDVTVSLPNGGLI